jgi:uncharacterized membrane protein
VTEKKSLKIWQICLITLVLFSAFLLRVYHIGTQSYWLDEMFSIYVAKFIQIKSLFWDTNPPLYHLLLRLWMKTFGREEFFVRLLSAMFSLAAIFVVFATGRKFQGFATGLIAAVLIAVHPDSIEMAQEARMYSLFEFLTAVNFYFFLCRNDGKRQYKAWLWSFLPLAITHYFAIMVITGEVSWHFWENKKLRKVSGYIGLYLSILLIFYLLSKTTGFFKIRALYGLRACRVDQSIREL